MSFTVKKQIAALLLLLLAGREAAAFCGFYVSKADGTLKNKTSQVILVRDGDRNVITMYNDYQGNLRDFAMVVPVPVVLQKDDIRVVDQALFQRLNDYSQPRLVEYYDENPCMRVQYDKSEAMALSAPASAALEEAKRHGVRIEAKYLVGEYDILILSAKESSGLRTWLTRNGYRIPEGAGEVLEPYIKSNLKFFVAKVNEAEKKKLPGNFLRPIQISFRSPKFMLPIRLGMANADGDQDLVVYAFTRSGRVECTNYRTVAMPTGQQVPLFVQKDFSRFYGQTFARTWSREGKSVALLEYAWDVSPRNFMKCDPCVAAAPDPQDMVQAGVWWLNGQGDYENVLGGSVFFTRIHFRYNRASFPQDLLFQATPNQEAFQARYVITHPATGTLDCPERGNYLRTLTERRRTELRNLRVLTGTGPRDWAAAPEMGIPVEIQYARLSDKESQAGKEDRMLIWGLLGMGALLTVYGVRRNNDV